MNPMLSVICLICLVAISVANASEVDALLEKSRAERETKEGQRYQDEFLKAIQPAFAAAIRTCDESNPDTKEPALIAFVVAANGQVRRLLHSDNIPFGECVASKLHDITTLPPPPHDDYIVGLGAANHQHEERSNGPPDKSFKATQEQLVTYDKAIAPFIAKARATYPEAKRRFLAGLPPHYRFSVRTRLSDPDGKVEDSFVEVNSIKGDRISGILGSVDLLTNYKTGQHITILESKIDNWVIVRPDGTEEGNYVGKFLDHYKPQ